MRFASVRARTFRGSKVWGSLVILMVIFWLEPPEIRLEELAPFLHPVNESASSGRRKISRNSVFIVILMLDRGE